MKQKMIIIYLLIAAGLLFAQNKTALLIANGSYDHFSSLVNPVSETRELRDVLRNLGFQVTLVTNASREEMLESIDDFGYDLDRRGGIALFHYSGHAVQVEGRNYLIPADADIPTERKITTRAVDADEILGTLEDSDSDTNIVILDSCRNNPLPAGSGKSASKGLAVIGRNPPNSIIVYSAQSGTVARDGVFTPALIESLSQQGLSFQEVLMRTRQRVYDRPSGSQTPGEYNQLFEPVYLAGRVGAPSGPISPSPSRPAAPEGFVLVEAGTFTMGSPSSEEDRNNDETQHRVTLTRDFYMAQYEVTQGL